VPAERSTIALERYAWVAGVIFVVALVAESVVGAAAIDLTMNDSATKIASTLADHRRSALLIAYLSVIYAAAFVVYLNGLYHLLRRRAEGRRTLATLLLGGGLLMIAMHAVSDIGLTGLLGAKLATYSAAHDPGLAYTLYLVTYVVDSVGDVFGSVFLVSAGLLGMETLALPRWLSWIAIASGVLLFVQGPTLGGVVADFGLAIDGIGFVLFLIFVLASSIVLLLRQREAPPRDASR
jgi:hypothetical protein